MRQHFWIGITIKFEHVDNKDDPTNHHPKGKICCSGGFDERISKFVIQSIKGIESHFVI